MKMIRFLTVLAFVASFPSAFAAPTVSVTAPTPGTTVSSLTSISLTFSEPVTGVAATALIVNGEPADAVGGSGAGPYVFSFPQPSPGAVTVAWDADHAIAGIGTGEFLPGAGWSYTLTDTIAPTLGKIRTSVAGQEMDAVRPVAGSTVGSLTKAVVTFSEIVTGVNAADLLVNGVAATSMTGENLGPYVFSFPSPVAGAVNFTWAAGHGIQDSVGNAFGGAGWSVTLGTAGSVVITEFLAANAAAVVAVGSDADGYRDENWDASPWVELYNPGATSVNLLGWMLTDDLENPAQWIFPARTLAAGGRLVVWASGKDRKPASGHLHTNFALNVSGGTLALFPPDSPEITPSSQWLNYPEQRYDFSYGTQASNGAVRYFSPPSVSQGAYNLPNSATPNPTAPPELAGVANPDSLLSALTPEPVPSVGRGFFNESFAVALTCADATATIRYTLDGSPPIGTSPAYTTPLNITNTAILRIAAFGTNKVPSKAVTHTYLFPSTVVNQPNPPYHKPGVTDNLLDPPAPGGTPLPYAWGTNATFTAAQTLPGFTTGTATGSNNLTAGQIPADYGMDPKIYADPTKYDDTGAINNTTGKTNLERINAALHSLPALSLVMKGSDMFGANGVTYTGTSPSDPLYPTSSATASWKIDKTKPCSLELIQGDGTTVFTIDAGIDLHGNASRDPFKNPKHGFTLRFKGKYGAGKLQAAVFPDSPVRDWDKLILRGDFGGSWLHQSGTDILSSNSDASQRSRGIRLREAFCKNAFRDMGHVASHHRFCNLFINGVCWGSYELMEDQAQDFSASYLGGGGKDLHDVIEQQPTGVLSAAGNRYGTLKSGSWNVWSAMKTLLGWTGGTPTSDVPDPPTDYLSTFSNAKYETLKTYLDLPWFEDYMIWQTWGGHRDWATDGSDSAKYMKNCYFIRPPGGTFKAMPWDMENILWHESEDRITAMTTFATAPTLFPPVVIHPRVKTNAEYRLEFADRAWRHMVRVGGALTPAANIARLDKWISVLGPDGICLESARWGDYRYKVHAYQNGTNAAGTLVTTTDGFQQVYTWNGAWYDNITTKQYDGTWDAGATLKFNRGRTTSSQLGTFTSGVMANAWYDEIRRLKTVYFPNRTTTVLGQYRTNGLYPFLNAPELRDNATNVVLGDANLPAGTLVKLALPAAGTGSSTGDIYYTIDGTDPRPQYDQTGTPRAAATLYSTPFAVTGPMVVKARARATLAGFPQKATVRAASIASVGTYVQTGGTSLRGQLTAAPTILDGVTLVAGDRILMKNQSLGAANGIYVVTTLGTGATGVWDRATDWDADGEAIGGTWVRVTAGTQNENSIWRVANTTAIVVGGTSGSALAFAAFSPWSALLELNLSAGPPIPTVAISEINYNPKGSQGGSAAEFVELVNYGTQSIDMTSWYLDGVDFVFPASFMLVPGQRIVVASNNNPTTFASQYPGVVVLGYFSGSLSNSGERLSLYNNADKLIASVEYGATAPWPSTPNNGGYSLEIVDPSKDPQAPGNWRASTALKGSPGQINGAASVSLPNVLLSEFLAGDNTDVGTDFVELHNAGATDVDISNWSLLIRSSGSGHDGTITFTGLQTLAAGARIAVLCTSQPGAGWRIPASLDSTQGTITLLNESAVSVDSVRYGPQILDNSFGRIGNSWSLCDPTPGAANSAIPTAPVTQLRLNEWLANPSAGGRDWLELYNLDSNDPINLTGLAFEKNGEYFRIAALTAIRDESHVLFFCDANSQSGNAILMQLPATGATISLRDINNNVLDTITYGPQATDVTQGRYPDGGGTVTTLTFPSPGIDNVLTPTNNPVINEVLVVNRNADVAPWAHRPAWIEIKNPQAFTIDLGNWQLRNSAGAVWRFPNLTSLAAGAYLVVWADPIFTQPTTQLNCGLALGQPETLELLNLNNQIQDRVTWGTQVADQSIGRLPDGSWALLANPTKGTANSAAAALAPVTSLKINEWLADNTGLTAPEFLELYNPANNPVSTAGLWLGDEPSETGRRKWQAPTLSFIGPQGFGYYQTSRNFLQNANTLVPFSPPPSATAAQSINFNLSVNGEYLRLSQNDASTTAIDSLTYGRFGAGSGGRYPDGNTNVQTLVPTPGGSNQPVTTGPALYEQPAALVRTLGESASFRVLASVDAVYYQWKLNGTDVAGATSNVLTISPVTLANEGDYTCLVTNLTGSTTSLSAKLTVLYNLSTWAQSLNIGSGVADDSDGDGLSNRLEFLLGTDPLSAVVPANPTAYYNFTGVEASGPNNLLNLELRLSPHAVYTSLFGNLSTDLTLWNPATPTTQLLSTEPNGDTNVRLKFTVPSTLERCFLRLQLVP